MKKLLCFLLFTSSLIALKAQERRTIDSLQNELGNKTTPLADSTKANLLIALSIQYQKINPDSADYYASVCISLSNKTGYKKGIAQGYSNLGIGYPANKNYPVLLENINTALNEYAEIGDKNNVAVCYFRIGLIYDALGNYQEGLKSFQSELKIELEIKNKKSIAKCYHSLGYTCERQGNYPEALKDYLYSLKIRNEIGDTNKMALTYNNIGDVYALMGNHSEALLNYMTSLKLNQKAGNKGEQGRNYRNIGLINAGQGNYPGAIKNQLLSRKLCKEAADSQGVARSNLHLGYSYYKQGNDTDALKSDLLALKQFEVIGESDDIIEATTQAASAYRQEHNLKEALLYGTKGLELATRTGYKEYIKKNYEELALINSKLGNYKAAYDNEVLYKQYYDSIYNKENENKLTSLQMQYDFDKKHTTDSLTFDAKSRIEAITLKKQKTLAVFGFLFLGIVSFLMINRQLLKRRKDKIIFEKEKQKMEGELAKAKGTLDEFITNMAEKNELLEQFKLDVENLKKLKVKEIDENRIENLEYLNKTTILTEEDWNKFKELFEQVYKGFFIRLKEKLPDLTQAETRLLCLTKLKLDTKQMGGILGVSFDTIHKSRYRLRKKLGLSEENNLDDIVNSI